MQWNNLAPLYGDAEVGPSNLCIQSLLRDEDYTGEYQEM